MSTEGTASRLCSVFSFSRCFSFSPCSVCMLLRISFSEHFSTAAFSPVIDIVIIYYVVFVHMTRFKFIDNVILFILADRAYPCLITFQLICSLAFNLPFSERMRCFRTRLDILFTAMAFHSMFIGYKCGWAIRNVNISTLIYR